MRYHHILIGSSRPADPARRLASRAGQQEVSMNRSGRLSAFALIALAAGLIFAGATVTQARPSYFTSRCQHCHGDDTPTCNGCHYHATPLSAAADHTEYYPGDPVVVTLSGGDEYGWVRGILYNAQDSLIARATGPTGTGDDGGPHGAVLPVQFQVTAPDEYGTHVWHAAWYGDLSNSGSNHGETRVAVTIRVVPTPAGLESAPPNVLTATWGRLKSIFH
jgi:hypothetical protein